MIWINGESALNLVLSIYIKRMLSHKKNACNLSTGTAETRRWLTFSLGEMVNFRLSERLVSNNKLVKERRHLVFTTDLHKYVPTHTWVPTHTHTIFWTHNNTSSQVDNKNVWTALVIKGYTKGYEPCPHTYKRLMGYKFVWYKKP